MNSIARLFSRTQERSISIPGLALGFEKVSTEHISKKIEAGANSASLLQEIYKVGSFRFTRHLWELILGKPIYGSKQCIHT